MRRVAAGRSAATSGPVRPAFAAWARAAVRLALVATGAVSLAACSGFPGVFEADRRGRLEVWNRTRTPITIVAKHDTVVVPACDHVARDDLVLNRLEIRDDHDRLVMIGTGGGPGPIYLMATGDGVHDAGPGRSNAPPAEPLPPCEGTIKGQPGS